jgi:hypothetical protein
MVVVLPNALRFSGKPPPSRCFDSTPMFWGTYRMDLTTSCAQAPVAAPAGLAGGPWLMNCQEQGWIVGWAAKEGSCVQGMHSQCNEIIGILG